MSDRFVRANFDKSHRCPECHGIVAYPFARWWRSYRCTKCKVRWWKGWHD